MKLQPYIFESARNHELRKSLRIEAMVEESFSLLEDRFAYIIPYTNFHVYNITVMQKNNTNHKYTSTGEMCSTTNKHTHTHSLQCK